MLALVSLIAFPFGTVLGVYGLGVLFSKDIERLFAVTAAHTPERRFASEPGRDPDAHA